MVFLFTGLYDMAFQVERKNKIRYTTGEVLNYLLAPGDDSDLSGLSDSDDNEIQESLNETDVVWDDQNETVEDNINAEREIESHAQAIREHTGASVPSTHAVVAGPSSFDDNRQKVPVTRQRSMISSSKKNDDDLNSELLDSDVVEPEDTFSDEEDEKITDAMRSHNFRWRNIEPPRDQRVFTGSPFSLPPEEFDDLQPYDFFTKFWSDDMTKLLVEQTNLYSVQATGKSVNTNFAEMEQLLGIHMMMGIINMPTYHYYWDSETRIGLIADAMSHNRYKALRRSIHVADNTFRDSRKNDKLFKIRPILEKLRENCLKIEPEPVMSIDEQIIPAKTRRSGIRQYNPKKPIKWGFKMFVRAGSSGLMHDFFLYTGKGSTGKENCSCEGSVLRLTKHLPKNENFKLCFDNWFSTLPLMLKMKELGILATATLRQNRIAKCPLEEDKALRKAGRGSSSHKVDANSFLYQIKQGN